MCTDFNRFFTVRTIKKLSYRRETARQLPTWKGAKPSSPLPFRPLWLHLCLWSNRKPATNVRQACLPLNALWYESSFKVIEGHPYWCRQESSTVCCRNVQLMSTLFLKLRKIWQRENGKFVDFNDPTQVWRRPSNKRIRISKPANDLYCQKLELLTYIFAADSRPVSQHSLVFT